MARRDRLAIGPQVANLPHWHITSCVVSYDVIEEVVKKFHDATMALHEAHVLGRGRHRHRLDAPAGNRRQALSCSIAACTRAAARTRTRKNRQPAVSGRRRSTRWSSPTRTSITAATCPTLVKNGFAGPIYTTPATIDLCNWMLRDTAHIQEKDAEFVNKRLEKRKAMDTSQGNGRRRAALYDGGRGGDAPAVPPGAYHEPASRSRRL